MITNALASSDRPGVAGGDLLQIGQAVAEDIVMLDAALREIELQGGEDIDQVGPPPDFGLPLSGLLESLNFARIHKTLRVTPAVEAGVVDHVWLHAEIARLSN